MVVASRGAAMADGSAGASAPAVVAAVLPAGAAVVSVRWVLRVPVAGRRRMIPLLLLLHWSALFMGVHDVVPGVLFALSLSASSAPICAPLHLGMVLGLLVFHLLLHLFRRPVFLVPVPRVCSPVRRCLFRCLVVPPCLPSILVPKAPGQPCCLC